MEIHPMENLFLFAHLLLHNLADIQTNTRGKLTFIKQLLFNRFFIYIISITRTIHWDSHCYRHFKDEETEFREFKECAIGDTAFTWQSQYMAGLLHGKADLNESPNIVVIECHFPHGGFIYKGVTFPDRGSLWIYSFRKTAIQGKE